MSETEQGAGAALLVMNGQKERIFIYRTGDPSTGAYLVNGSPIYVENPQVSSMQIEMDHLVSGVLELFLSERRAIPPRLFSLAVDEGADIKTVDFGVVTEMARKYEFGFSANRFLAVLIDRTNELLREAVKRLPPEWQLYRARAAFFADLVHRLAKIANAERVGDFMRLVERSRRTALYRDGINFKKERLISKISYNAAFEGAAVRFVNDTVLCRTGETADSIFVLLEGAVYVSKDEQIIASITEAGECFGELAFFIRGKRTADLTAAANTAVMKIEKGALREFHNHHPEMFLQIAATLAKRVEHNVEMLSFYNSAAPEESQKLFKESPAAAKKEILEFIDGLKAFVRIAFNREINVLIASALKEKSLRDG